MPYCSYWSSLAWRTAHVRKKTASPKTASTPTERTTAPRYEPQNRRLLVDWTTGTVVGALGINLDDTLIRAWSGDCRYLAVATGSVESRATAVYDTVDMRYVGEVPDARIVPHPITWGPDDFLMVEGRNGAVLWNVPANIQYPLHVGFNTTTYRNFSRLRWDADNKQLTANLANGGRIVYDLTTGEATIAAYSRPGELVLGGERFACTPNFSGERGGATTNYLVGLKYAFSGGVMSIGRWTGGGSFEALQTLEANVPSLRYQEKGWSANCRYIAASMESATLADSYDTIIWDVLNQRRVGTYPDARGGAHRLSWDTAEKNVLVETRDGAFLWNLETGARVLVNDVVQQPPINCRPTYSECQPISFHHMYWDAGQQQFLGVPVLAPNTIVAYDVNTGAEVTRYVVEGASAEHPAQFITSNNSRLLLIYVNGWATLLDRVSGTSTSFNTGITSSRFTLRSDATISTDNRFLAMLGYDLRVWDLTSRAPSSTPISLFRGIYIYNPHFINADTVVGGYLDQYQYRVNVVTGQTFGAYGQQNIDPDAQPVQSYTAIPGTSGEGKEFWEGDQPQCSVSARYDVDARQILVDDLAADTTHVVAENVNTVRKLLLSPDCQTIYADVQRRDITLPYDETPGNESYRYDELNEVIFWDVRTGDQLFTQNVSNYFSHVWWNPDGNRALAQVFGAGYYLIVPAKRIAVPIVFQDTDRGRLPMYIHTYWDHERGIVLVAGYGEVFAIDMQTGHERLRFPALEGMRGGCNDIGCGMDVDGAWVFVQGDDSMSAWNMDTLEHTTVPDGMTGSALQRTLISPDGRYLVVSRTMVRVWDVQNLPETYAEREPIARFYAGSRDILSMRFVDNMTLEVVTRTEDATATTRYDVTTGYPM